MINPRMEVLEGLKEIAILANNVWMGRVDSRLDTVLKINRIAEKLIEKEQDKMTCKDFTFDQLLCLNNAHTKAEIAIDLLNDAASCYDYLPVSNELAKKIQPRLEQIAQEIADLNRELYNYVNAKERNE